MCFGIRVSKLFFFFLRQVCPGRALRGPTTPLPPWTGASAWERRGEPWPRASGSRAAWDELSGGWSLAAN